MNTKEYYKKYWIKNKKRLSVSNKKYGIKYRLRTKGKKMAYDKIRAPLNRHKNNISRKKYCSKNKDKVSKYNKEYRCKNRERLNKLWRKYVIKRRETDVNFNLRIALSKRLRTAITKKYKKSRAVDLLGCDIAYAVYHIQSLFTEGMSWENYGQWHIDHKLPCASFDLTKEEEQKKCFHYTNLQPLWAKDNRLKGDKLVY